jgi:hypothetical protein
MGQLGRPRGGHGHSPRCHRYADKKRSVRTNPGASSFGTFNHTTSATSNAKTTSSNGLNIAELLPRVRPNPWPLHLGLSNPLLRHDLIFACLTGGRYGDDFSLTTTEHDPHLRAGKNSDDTHITYRVAAFQAFLSGRI